MERSFAGLPSARAQNLMVVFVTRYVRLFLSYSLLGAFAVLSAQTPQKAQKQVNPTHDAPAEHVYKNIRVLKGAPSDEVIPAMQFVASSLGVECNFCHVENQFELDDKKPKQVARKMMEMQIAINQNHFREQQRVTCNTCHRGSRTPVSIPLITEGDFNPILSSLGEETPNLNLPSVDQVLMTYVHALGGADAVGKVTTLQERGITEFNGQSFPVEIFEKTPAMRIVVTHLPDGDSTAGFNGNTGWFAAAHRPIRPLPVPELEGAKMDADLQFALHLKEFFGGLRPAPPETIAGQLTDQLIAEDGDTLRARLYFDQHSGLLTRIVRYAKSPLGLNPTRIDYGDYRMVEGVQMPFRWEIARPASRITIQLREVKSNLPLDDRLFVEPSVTQPGTPAASAQ
jgi:photosynthetic reaction center cytochrome c subunit